MPEFISKLQYKTYEKGEYSDEKSRKPDEIIKLIKSFPWEEQRGADVQLTGPSVTIKDEYGNYLKVGLHFNGKYRLYYLDCDDHLYEYPASDFDSILSVATDFFNGQIDLQKFEKHLFNIGNQGHFITKDFIYRVKPWRTILSSRSFIVLFLMFLVFTFAFISTNAPFFIFGVPLLLSLPFGGILIYIIRKYLASSNQILQISKGNAIFSFGNDSDENTYNKNDIKEIIEYARSRGHDFIVYEIRFADESMIKFSTILISDFSLSNKFSRKLFIYNKKNSLWQL